MKIPENLKKKLRGMHYGIAGHAAVEICTWTKKHLRDEGSCYKRKFYGIDTNCCAQIAPTPVWCEHNCIYCWRPMEFMTLKRDGESMKPAEMISGLVEERKKLLSGFKGSKLTNQEKFYDAYNRFPSHWAISLSGEPTLYDKLGKLIKLLRENKEVRSIFVVSNGQEPEVLEKLNEFNLLPVQLYISVNAPNEELYKKISNPEYKDGWERLRKTLSGLKNFKTRTVIRFTQMKGINDSDELVDSYVKLFQSTQSDFIEVKAFMIIGYSRKRLKIENMPSHQEVMTFAKKLAKKLPDYEIIDECKISRIVLLKNKKSQVDNLIIFNDPKYKEVDQANPKWTIYSLLQKYRKVRFLLDKRGFNCWDKDYLMLEKQAKRLGIEVNEVVEEINQFIEQEYKVKSI